MMPAFNPAGTLTVPKPGTLYEDAAGWASYRSMSYMSTESVGSTTPVICHCQVVPGLGRHTALVVVGGALVGDAEGEGEAEADVVGATVGAAVVGAAVGETVGVVV